MSLGFSDVLYAECPNSIYEAKDADEWAACRQKKGRIGIIIAIIIIIIIALIVFFLGGTLIKIVTGLGAVILITGIALSHFIWTPMTARAEFIDMERDIKIRTETGMSRKDAIEAIRRETYASASFGTKSSGPQAPGSSVAAAFTPVAQFATALMSKK